MPTPSQHEIDEMAIEPCRCWLENRGYSEEMWLKQKPMTEVYPELYKEIN